VDESDNHRALANRLREACFEIIPLTGIENKVDHIPSGATVAITCSPDKGVDATLDLTRLLLDREFRLVPHVAARMVADESHLRDILEQLDEIDIRRIFVIAGDAEQPAGKFDSSLQLLRSMAEIDHGIKEIGIGAYPEGHPLIDDATLLTYLQRKQSYAAYMVTQMCFDPDVLTTWLREMRGLGINLPVKIGIPGVAPRAKLLDIALKIGVGQSVRFLKSHRKLVGKLIKPGGYSPDRLVSGFAPYVADRSLDISSFHIYTFNQLETTEEWRSNMISSLTE